jgi:hypothetical protein
LDTSLDADALQRSVYERLGGSGRVEIAFRLNEMVRRLTMAGIRARHPEYGDELVRQAYARLVLGEATVRAIWPDREPVDP